MPSPAASADAKPSSQRLLKTILVGLFCCYDIQAAWAVPPVYTITQNAQLTFGTMQVPGGSATDVISTAGAQSGTGTYLYGSVNAGDYTITCTKAGVACPSTTTFTLSITNGSGCVGLTSLGSWQGNYNHGANSGSLPLSGLADPVTTAGLDFKLGATATYTSSVSAGSCTPTFTIGLLDSNGVTGSATENASIGFDVGLALNKNSDINFGTVTASNASTYRISTAGAVSTASGTGTRIYGTPSAGSITISGSASDTITISAGSYTANNGVTPSNATCSYNGAAATACPVTGAAPGAGKQLLIGVDVAADGTQAAGSTAAPTFVMSVTYN